jgi:hypothetical protein
MKMAPVKARSARAEMVVEPKLLPHLLVRCRGECREFKMQSQAATVGCSVCDFHTVRCHGCGGEVAARRAALSHHQWFASKRGVKMFGGMHRPSWEAYKEQRDARRKLKLAKGKAEQKEAALDGAAATRIARNLGDKLATEMTANARR